MHTFIDCFHAGLVEACEKSGNICAATPSFHLGWLQADIVKMFQGSAADKREARAHLEKYIHRGRCLLNAADQMNREPDSSNFSTEENTSCN